MTNFMNGSELGVYHYVFRKGYYSETIDYYQGDSHPRMYLGLNFTEYDLADLQLRKEGFDLIVKANDSDAEITLKGYYQDYSDVRGYTAITGLRAPYPTLPEVEIQGKSPEALFSRIENVEGDRVIRGTGDSEQLIGGIGNNVIFGAGGDDVIYGLAGNDILYGGAGNDTLYGNTGNDLLFGGNGQDRLYGGTGDDWLYGEAGIDVLDGGKGNDILYGGSGSDLLQGGEGNDTLYGGGDNDVLEGGAGDDTLRGDVGKDIYLFARGHGADTVIDNAVSNDPSTFYSYTEPKFFARSDNDLVLYSSEQDQITVKDYFISPNHFELQVVSKGVDFNLTSSGIEAQIMDDGLIASFDSAEINRIAQDLPLSATLYGTAESDTLTGENARSNIIYGLDGNDTIYGGDGNDLLIGGKGSDTLYGGAGGDTYIFSRGHGSDVVVDSPNGDSPNVLIFNGIEIGSGWYTNYTSEQPLALFSRSENDLLIQTPHYHSTRYGDYTTFGSVKVTDYFNNPEAFKFVFDDRSIESYDRLLDLNSELAYYDTDGGISASSATTALEQQNTQAVI